MRTVPFLLSLLFGFASAGVFKVPIRRVESSLEKRVRKVVMSKEHGRSLQVLGFFGQNVADDGAYLANVSIGTPPQQFTVLLDTSSSNFWVPDIRCTDGALNGENYCVLKHHFNSSATSTYQRDGTAFTIHYENGTVSGFQGVDVVAFGNSEDKNVLRVPKTTFGQVIKLDTFFDGDNSDGILGLAFQTLSVNNVRPVLLNAMDQGLLDQPLFTVYFRHQANAHGEFGGIFTYGAIDVENCGPVTDTRLLSSATYYQFKIDGFYIRNFSKTGNFEAISSTSSSMIGLPPDYAKGVADAVGGILLALDGVYFIDCNRVAPDLVLTIGGKPYAIKSENLIINYSGLEICILGVTSLDFGGFGPSFILGDPFIRQFCNIYDFGNKQISFAPSLQPL